MNTKKDISVVIIKDALTKEDNLGLHLKQNGISSIRYIYGWNHFTAISKEQTDIIFVDYNSDVLSGLVIVKKITRDLPSAFVVMLCNHKNVTVAIESLKYGAFDYIVKGREEAIYTRLVTERIAKAIDLRSHTGSKLFAI